MTHEDLPSDVVFLERGWLNSNTTLLLGPKAVVIDSGYHQHAPQLVSLIEHELGIQAPAQLINTHLHSDHCGGNQTLQHHWPQIETFIPKSIFESTCQWDPKQLTFELTGQECPRFQAQGGLLDGQELKINSRTWEIHNTLGHHADSFVLFAPQERLLISADTLWEDGFGVLFDEFVTGSGFEAQEKTLHLIESLKPRWVLPGHGRAFNTVTAALKRAYSRLEYWQNSPQQHAQHAALVIIKFHLMVVESIQWDQLLTWARSVPLLKSIHNELDCEEEFDDWILKRLESLVNKNAAEFSQGLVRNRY